MPETLCEMSQEVKPLSTCVLHVVGAMNMGGAEVMLMDIFRNIPKEFHFDFLVNQKTNSGNLKGDFDDEILENGGDIHHIATQWSIGPFAYRKRIRELLKKVSYDIVHIHLNAKSGIIAWAFATSGVKNIIVHSHADLKFRGNPIRVFINKFEMKFQQFLIANYAKRFWGCSTEANKSLFYSRLLTSETSAVINNAINTAKYANVQKGDVLKVRESYGFRDQTLILGNIGRVVAHKNIAFILDVLANLKSKNIDAAFVFAGRGDDESYLKMFWEKASALGVKEKVLHLGQRSDVEVVMSSFDVYLGPALQEGFGLVAVEAQAAGLPALLYKGFPERVDMKQGLVTFFESFDIEKWTSTVLKQRDMRKSDVKQISDAIKTLGFDSQKNTENVFGRYNKLLGT